MRAYFQIDPQAQAVIDLAWQQGAKPLSSLTPLAARAAYRAGRLPTQPLAPADVLSRDLSVAGPAGEVPVREYRPRQVDATEVLPTLVFFHGGGWVVGDRDTHDVLCRMLCAYAGCAVYSVDYRLAPEHRFPAAFDDACAAVRVLAARAVELCIDAKRLAVGGDSAGGGLATAVALALRDDASVRLAAQVLAYPVTDLSAQSDSYDNFATGYVLSAADMHYFRDHYVVDPSDYGDWRVSPLRAPTLKGMPPTLLLTAGYDPLHDEGRCYADRLAAEGNALHYVCFERQMHGFLGMGGVIEEANTAVRLCAEWLRHQLA